MKINERWKIFLIGWIRNANMHLVCLVDIFEQLNKLNRQIQESKTNIFIQFINSLKAFMCKLKNWKRMVNIENIAMLEKQSSILAAGKD